MFFYGWSEFITYLKTKGSAEANPRVLTNPLNSSTKLQIAATVQNNF